MVMPVICGCDQKDLSAQYLVSIWCQNDVVSTWMRRDHVASTLMRRHFYVMCPAGINCFKHNY